MKTVIVTTILGLGVTMATTATKRCPANWVLFEDRCYRFPEGLEEWMTWDEAASYCEAMDSHLPQLPSSAEQEFLREHQSINSDRYTYWLGVKYGGSVPASDVPNKEGFHTPSHCYTQGKDHCGRFQGSFWTLVDCDTDHCGQGIYPVCVKPALPQDPVTTDPTPSPTSPPKPPSGLNGECWDSSKTMEERDAMCEGDLVCARAGWDGRDFGGCVKDANGNYVAGPPFNHHCCSIPQRVPGVETDCREHVFACIATCEEANPISKGVAMDYYCSKGCTRMGNGDILAIDDSPFCKDPPKDAAECSERCAGASDLPERKAACEEGCAYWLDLVVKK